MGGFDVIMLFKCFPVTVHGCLAGGDLAGKQWRLFCVFDGSPHLAACSEDDGSFTPELSQIGLCSHKLISSPIVITNT